jgi:hypothetical protein
VELSRADEVHDLIVFSHAHGAKLLKQLESCLAVREIAAGEFTDYERVNYDFAATEMLAEWGLALAKVVNPYRRVGEDHIAAEERLLGIGSSCGWVPPSLASRKALSRSMSAFSPSRSTAERSRPPVSLVALASRSSSSVTVVRI